MLKTYHALILPTGETTSGDKQFPVSSLAAAYHKNGRCGFIFITGGHGGFAKKDKNTVSEARVTFDYLVNKRDIDPSKIFYDDRSLDTMGNFTSPEVGIPFRSHHQSSNNPRLSDFDDMLIIGKKDHI